MTFAFANKYPSVAVTTAVLVLFIRSGDYRLLCVGGPP